MPAEASRITIWNEVGVTFWICVPLSVLLPPGKLTVTVSPFWKPLPDTVTIWLLLLAVGMAGVMELMSVPAVVETSTLILAEEVPPCPDTEQVSV